MQLTAGKNTSSSISSPIGRVLAILEQKVLRLDWSDLHIRLITAAPTWYLLIYANKYKLSHICKQNVYKFIVNEK